MPLGDHHDDRNGPGELETRLTHFIEELKFLSESDKDWVLGRADLGTSLHGRSEGDSITMRFAAGHESIVGRLCWKTLYCVARAQQSNPPERFFNQCCESASNAMRSE